MSVALVLLRAARVGQDPILAASDIINNEFRAAASQPVPLRPPGGPTVFITAWSVAKAYYNDAGSAIAQSALNT